MLKNKKRAIFLLILKSYSGSSSNFIPIRKQSTAYMSKDTSVNQYTLMFCWCSPEKSKAYLAGNHSVYFILCIYEFEEDSLFLTI